MLLNQPRARRGVVPRRFGPISSPGTSSNSIIPYDYAARFELRGIPGNIVQDVINVSVEGVFVAVAIGYGFEEERGQSIEITTTALENPGDITLGRIPVEALITGFRLEPRLGPTFFPDQPLPPGFASKLFQRVKPPEEISFLFSIVDSATGRELQDEPTHNIASLGTANGERPFRLLAQPLTFLPRSTMRLQIIERSEGIKGTLFIVLYGYKILGASSCPEPLMRSLRGSPTCPTETIGNPRDRTIPFDYVARLELIGSPKNMVETEVPINVEGGFVATALGYGLAVETSQLPIRIPQALATRSKFPLSALPLSAFSTRVLSDGVRIRPDFVRIAFTDNGELASLSVDLANKLFESLNRAEDVSFRYTIFDGGRGIELQNQPIHNIAGLGIANGERPFKRFARPMIFLPRSTIRITLEEQFGRGTLFLVFQGYKVLGRISGIGGRP
jgi:hypothetical protein